MIVPCPPIENCQILILAIPKTLDKSMLHKIGCAFILQKLRTGFVKKGTDEKIFSQGADRQRSEIRPRTFDMTDVPPIGTVSIHETIGMESCQQLVNAFCKAWVEKQTCRIVQ